MMNILSFIDVSPRLQKLRMNHFAPYRGAGIEVKHIDLQRYEVDVNMNLTRKNKNIVETHFGPSLYAMVDPFYMMILMHHLGRNYIIWDKSVKIHYKAPARNAVHANIQLDQFEIETVRALAESYEPVLRTYKTTIFDELGLRVAEVEKTVYIRKMAKSGDRLRR